MLPDSQHDPRIDLNSWKSPLDDLGAPLGYSPPPPHRVFFLNSIFENNWQNGELAPPAWNPGSAPVYTRFLPLKFYFAFSLLYSKKVKKRSHRVIISPPPKYNKLYRHIYTGVKKNHSLFDQSCKGLRRQTHLVLKSLDCRTIDHRYTDLILQ